MNPDVAAYARHTTFTEPGPHAALLATVPADPDRAADAVSGLVVHYTASGLAFAPERLEQVDDRWVTRTLGRLAAASPEPLDRGREAGTCAVGCCRDFSLLFVAAMRAHGVPARTRLGFAPYIPTGEMICDHVVAEYWDGADERWVRVDPQFQPARAPGGADVRDLGTAESSPFRTAAQVWVDHRAGRLGDGGVDRYGVVGADLPLHGEWMVGNYVLGELAHLTGHELLLWDLWGAMDLGPLTVDVEPARARTVAPHLVAGRTEEDRTFVDLVAAALLDPTTTLARLHELARDPRADPRPGVLCLSPSGRGGAVGDLRGPAAPVPA